MTDQNEGNGTAVAEPREQENGYAMVRHAKEESGSIAAFASHGNFDAAQRMAMALSRSSLVPTAYQGKDGLPNCLIAMEMANRIGASVFMVMQNLDIIHNRPSWRSTFLIATVNTSGRFSPLRYRFQGGEGTDEWGCRAYAADLENGEECEGPLVTISMAKAEGWYQKKGSKWQTLPELMLRYRAAAFWTRVYAPELSMGMHTADEVQDAEMGTPGPSRGAADLTKELERVRARFPENGPDPDVEVGTKGDGDDPDADGPVQEADGAAKDGAIDGLCRLRDKARDAGAIDSGLEEAVDKALKSKSAAAVQEASKLVSRALAKAAGEAEQGTLMEEG